MTTINLRKKKNKEKYSYLIAFNHKQCGSDYGKQWRNEDQVSHSPPSLDARQSARLVRLWPDLRADGVLDNSRPPRAHWPGKGGSYGGGRRGSRRAGGAPAPGPGLSSWLEYMALSTSAASLFWRCRVLGVLASLSCWLVFGHHCCNWCLFSETGCRSYSLQFESTPENMEMSRNSLTLLT